MFSKIITHIKLLDKIKELMYEALKISIFLHKFLSREKHVHVTV